jgi:hypothetical protein
MSALEKVIVKDQGAEYEFLIESQDDAQQATQLLDEEPGYRDINLPTVDMQKVHDTIRGYARYAIGAFTDFGLADIEEMNLEFNLKIAGKAGLPILAEASSEGTFKIQVKCKFPKTPDPQT